jgi:hypothetical protein
MPVQYKDLGKKANDLFNKNYEHGKYSLEVKSSGEGHEFTTKGHQDNATGKLSSSHEHKMKVCKLGTLKATFKPGDNSIAADLENKSLVKDTKFNLLFNMGLSGCPIPDVKALKVNYACPNINLDLESNLGNSVTLAAVLQHEKLPATLGFNGAFDLGKTALTKKELAFAVNKGSIDCVTKTSFNNDMNCLISNNVKEGLVLATHINHKASVTSIAMAASVAAGCGATNQFKASSNGRVAISHITPSQIYGSKITFGGEFDAFNLGSGSHKVGMGLKFDL